MKQYLSPIVLTLFILTTFTGCKHEEASLTLVNKVHNVLLTDIRFGDHYLGSSLQPNEKTKRTFSDEYDDISFPIVSPITFRMVKGSRSIYLQTEEVFELEAWKDLTITIDDDTRLIDPANDSQ